MHKCLFRVVAVALCGVLISCVASGRSEKKDTTQNDLAVRVEKLEQQLKAQKPSPFTVGGTIFSYYVYSREGVNGKDYNRFDFDRSYITVKGQLAEGWKVQLTTDMYRGADTNTFYKGLSVRMKFAYVEYAPGDFSVKLGLIPGQFNSIEEAAWKYRGIASVPSDRYGYLPTADLGASVGYTIPDKYGEVSAFITNGKGYTAPEADKFKDFTVRATVKPMPNDPYLKTLSVAAFASKGYESSKKFGGLKKDRIGGAVSYAYDIASVGLVYVSKTDAPLDPEVTVGGSAISVFGEVKAPWDCVSQFSLIARYDAVEPSKAKANDKYNFLIAGLVYKANDKVTFSFDFQGLTGEAFTTLAKSGGGAVHYDGRLYLHTIVIF